MWDTRAQTFTLEGVFSALVVIAGLAFALQAVVVPPTDGGVGAGTGDGGQLERILEQSVSDESVKRAVLAWDGSAYFGTPPGQSYFVDDLPDNEFGNALQNGFDSSASINIVVHYEASSGPDSQRLAYNGVPEDGAVRETVTVSLYDLDSIYDENGDMASGTLDSTSSGYLYVEDRYSSSPGDDLYAVVQVEVVVW